MSGDRPGGAAETSGPDAGSATADPAAPSSTAPEAQEATDTTLETDESGRAAGAEVTPEPQANQSCSLGAPQDAASFGAWLLLLGLACTIARRRLG